MQKLQDIEVRVESKEQVLNHANATPILHEIHHALLRLITQRQPTTIDLRAIPFGPGDEDELLNRLGQGEVSIQLDSLGTSTIWETAYSGVWVVDHRNAEGERVALQIEVTQTPGIIQSHPDDMADALQLLDKQLNPSPSEHSDLGEE